MDITTRNLLERNAEDMPDSQREWLVRNSWLGSIVFSILATVFLVVMIVLFVVNH